MDLSIRRDGYLTWHLLVAMPGMSDERFARSVVFLCAHSEEGAMGIVINRELESLTFEELIEQLDLKPGGTRVDLPVQAGGPVETGRGFVLHSVDYRHEGTLVVGEDVALTATVDILRAIAQGEGPRRRILALGYAGWSPGQLEAEIRANGWLNVAADADLVFDPALDEKWERAMAKIGVDARMLSTSGGHA